MSDDAVLKAQAEAAAAVEAARQAQAAAEAAVQRAQEAAAAARAQADAAAAAPAPAPDAAAEASGTAPASGPLTAEQVDVIRAGYAFEEASLDIGALVNGEALADVQVRIPLAMTNRHGLVAGATGTGKTRTLQTLAEQLAAAGVPVFAADMKGDLSGVATPGESSPKLLARTEGIGQSWEPRASTVEYFSLGGIGKGVPIRATLSGFGPLLLSKVLGLNDTQESSLGLVFHYAEQAGLPLLDLSDLRAVLTYLTSDEGKVELKNMGGLSNQTVGVILRELIAFSAQGAEAFFGEPEIDTSLFLRRAADGSGVISLLELPRVADKPALFSTFLMWLLADLYNDLPEVGDLDKPKLVFFFDEAHLLFTGASKDFLQSITQTVRLIRSKGVGIFFVTQTPKDVPGDVLAQLGSRVQHALRAFTPDDAKALRATVSTYPKSAYDLEQVLQGLGTGEAVVTVMNEKGAPSPVAWTRVRAPQGSMAPTPDAAIDAAVAASPLTPQYGTPIDRESAREMLTVKMNAAAAAAAAAEAQEEYTRQAEEFRKQAEKEARAQAQREARESRSTSSSSSRPRSRTTKPDPNVLNDVLGSKTTQTILKGVLDGIFGTRRRR
ncbi:helicase HerA-like domain-containing protein [Herbiconiux sp. YIM B11900]|uniref:helicase HerA-like domain-containing protein n=1 Tax=Herbiconiux sp. YIM B11900 TaxID=3404131 RepID=UPI003F854458